MKKYFYRIVGIASFIWVLLAVLGSSEALAEVNFNVNIGPPPVLTAPPDVVLMPGSQVYYVPQPGVDIFFYNGWWWAPRGDRWYRAKAYNGPWGIVARHYVPGPVFGVPRDYRRRFAGERRIPYGEWRKNRGGHGREHHEAEHGREHEHFREKEH